MRREPWIARSFGPLMIVAALGLTLAGCAPTQTCNENGCSEPPQILHLPVAGANDIRTLDPPNATDPQTAQFAELIFPGLVALDKNLTAIPWAAPALPTVSSDGLTWTFTLRPGLKWSDGTAITSETYAFSMDRAENPCNAFGGAYYLYAIKDAVAFNSETCDTSKNTVKGPIQTLIGDSILVPNTLTLQIHLAAPAAYFLSAMTWPASYAVPERLVKQYGNKWTKHLADGTGFGGDMFKVTKWDHAGHLVLTRNDAFFGTKPKLREVDVTFYRDMGAAYSAYLAGQVDVGSAPVSQLATAKTHKAFHEFALQQLDYYGLNWHDAPFDDIRMRQAFDIALDKTTLANITLHGAVEASNHIVPNGMPGYNPALTGPDGTTNLGGDTQKANQLATAYATDKHCGTATDFSHCPPVTLTLFQDSPDIEAEARAAQQMWLKAMPNYPITISEFAGGLLQTTATHQFQFWTAQWTEDYPDPQDWLTTNLACDSAYNSGFACDKQADDLMKAADANPDQATRLVQYQQAEQILVTDVAWIPLDQPSVWWETASALQNFTISSTGLIPRESWSLMFLTSH